MEPTRFLRPWDFPGKSTGVGCYCLLLAWGKLGLNWRIPSSPHICTIGYDQSDQAALFFLLVLFYWCKVNLQCFVNFCYTTKWFNYICTFFFIFFSIMVYPRILNIAPCVYSRALLFIHPLYNSLYLLTTNSNPSLPHPSLATTNSNPSLPHPSLATASLLSVSVSCFYFIDRLICAIV